MDNAPKDPFIAERSSWGSIAPWMVPSLLVPIVLALVLVGYVVILAAQ